MRQIRNQIKLVAFSAARSVLGILKGLFSNDSILASRVDDLDGNLRARQCHTQFDYAFRQIKPDHVCIDLGANQGVYTELLARRAGQVFAFEPDPWAFAALRERVGRKQNVTLIEAAAGTSTDAIKLFRNFDFDDDPAAKSLGSSIVPEKTDIDHQDAISVAQIDFVTWLEKQKTDIFLLKVDIEGAEVALLEKLLASPAMDRITWLFVETHEHLVPSMADRIATLRARVSRLPHTKAYLDWW